MKRANLKRRQARRSMAAAVFQPAFESDVPDISISPRPLGFRGNGTTPTIHPPAATTPDE
jgi:hypothetical protein